MIFERNLLWAGQNLHSHFDSSFRPVFKFSIARHANSFEAKASVTIVSRLAIHFNSTHLLLGFGSIV